MQFVSYDKLQTVSLAVVLLLMVYVCVGGGAVFYLLVEWQKVRENYVQFLSLFTLIPTSY